MRCSKGANRRGYAAAIRARERPSAATLCRGSRRETATRSIRRSADSSPARRHGRRRASLAAPPAAPAAPLPKNLTSLRFSGALYFSLQGFRPYASPSARQQGAANAAPFLPPLQVRDRRNNVTRPRLRRTAAVPSPLPAAPYESLTFRQQTGTAFCRACLLLNGDENHTRTEFGKNTSLNSNSSPSAKDSGA